MNLSKDTKFSLSAGSTIAGTGDVNGAEVDMSGFEGVVFTVEIATANAGNLIKAQGADVSGGPWNDLAGTGLAVGDNGDVAVLDVYRPRNRYIRAVVERGVSTALGPIIAQQYEPRNKPTSHGSTVDSELHVSPAQGTA